MGHSEGVTKYPSKKSRFVLFVKKIITKKNKNVKKNLNENEKFANLDKKKYNLRR